jgi:hypothetical protein
MSRLFDSHGMARQAIECVCAKIPAFENHGVWDAIELSLDMAFAS